MWVVYGWVDPRDGGVFLVDYDDERWVSTLLSYPTIEEGEPGFATWRAITDAGLVPELVELERCGSEGAARKAARKRVPLRTTGD